MAVLCCCTRVVKFLLTLPLLLLSAATALFTVLVSRKRGTHEELKGLRVAVIGGGIAGSAAAWSLKKGGAKHVALYEKMATVGGNAKVNHWQTSPPITTGLSVLAWPDKYFHNYNELLRILGIDTTLVNLPFFVENMKTGVFAHQQTSELKEQLSGDLERWLRMIKFVQRVNSFFHGGTPTQPSLYSFSVLNPLNILSLRLLSRMFGVRAVFWTSVVVPVYSSSFLTIKLDSVPAVIVPVLHDLIPLDACPTMRTWAQNSTLVFEKLLQGIWVETDSTVARVSFGSGSGSGSGGSGPTTITVQTQKSTHEYDRIVFACSADAAAAMMESPSTLESFLLTSVGYADDDDISFREGCIHSDPTVLPSAHRAALLKDYANYIRVSQEGGVENTFILSSWIPEVQRSSSTTVRSTPMLVTYNNQHPIVKPCGTVSNVRAHPHMSPANTLLAILLRLVQGRRGVYYCGSFTTPGNGHDLSLLSGLIVAHMMGAPYPFAGNAQATKDFEQLRRIMGI